MKNREMKKWFIGGALIFGMALYSCNHSNVDSRFDEDNPRSNAVIVPTLMDGTPAPEVAPAPADSSAATQPAATSEATTAGAIDVNGPSDSKGVGKFTAVKVDAKLDGAMAAKGKELFQTYCTACHTPTDKKLIGPGLAGITKIRTPEWILNMITNPVEMTHKDPVAQALLAEANNVQMTDLNVSDQDARSILEFLRQNDGVK